MTTDSTPLDVLDRLVTAVNDHDLDRLVGCFAEDYRLTDPVHPARSFEGAAQVRRNWSTMFAAVPDVHLEVQDRAVTDSGFWLEATQAGTRHDGVRLTTRTVFVAKVDRGQIHSAHMYAAPVEEGGPGIDAVFAAMAGRPPTPSPRGDEGPRGEGVPS